MWFLPALTLLFVGLKLTHYIDWSWWYVTMPSWGILAICLSAWLLCQTGLLIIEIIQRFGETKEETEQRHAAENAAKACDELISALKRR